MLARMESYMVLAEVTYNGFWGSIGDTIWWLLTVFMMVAYLMVLLSVVSDLFRDRTLPGWGKAIWAILLIFVPLLTMLAYLITRGPGMARRAAATSDEIREARESYIKEVAGGSPAAEIATAKTLLDDGAITAQEFAAIKQRTLSA